MFFKNILIIHSPKINLSDSNADCIVLRALFAEWPKDRLHQIYYSNNNMDKGFCSTYYNFTIEDRICGKLIKRFFNKKDLPKGMASANLAMDTPANTSRYLFILKSLFYYFDILFFPIINRNLNSYLNNIKPNLLYVQGYTLRNILLTIKISKKYGIPIAVHPLDDWASNSLYRHKNSLILKFFWKYYTKKLFNASIIRLAVSIDMKRKYERMYGHRWEVIPVIANYEAEGNFEDEFNPISDWKQNNYKKIAICFTGSLSGGRNKAISSFAEKVDAFNKNNEIEGIQCKIFIFTHNFINASILLKHSCISINEAVKSTSIPYLLESSEILLIAESFDESDSITNQLVLSSKVPFYTRANRPILVIGHSYNGTIRSAIEYKWALTITESHKIDIEYIIKELMKTESCIYCKNAEFYYNNFLNTSNIQKEFIRYLNIK